MDARTIRIVIVGSGYGGLATAFELDKFVCGNKKLKLALVQNGSERFDKLEVIWLSRMDAFHFSTGTPRSLVDKKAMHTFFVPIDKLWPSGKLASPNYKAEFIHATIMEVHPGHVLIQKLDSNGTSVGDPETLEFTYLASCLGSTVPTPFKSSAFCQKAAIEQNEKVYEALKKAKSVVIVGGGPTGIESACEIKEAYPNCHVTLIDPNDALMARDAKNGIVGKKLQLRLTRTLAQKNIALMLKEKVISPTATTLHPSTVELLSGKALEADMILYCNGFQTNSTVFSPLASTNPSCIKDGVLAVNGKLQLLGYPAIFAVGDLIRMQGEAQLALIARFHALYLTQTVFAALLIDKFTATDSKSDAEILAKLPNYKPFDKKMVAISTGKTSGQMQLSHGLVLGSWITKFVKAKDMYFSRFMAGEYGKKISYESDFAK
jgi:NADH dehydrogenase FAD-containing subunit